MKIKIKKILLFVFAFAVLAAGCSKKQVKPVPKGAVYYRNASRLISALRKGYIQKDPDIIRSVSTSNGYNQVAPGLGRFDSVKLSFTVTWLNVKDSAMDATVEWNGVWTKGGQKDKENGTAVFELKGAPLKFNAVLSGSPFIYPK